MRHFSSLLLALACVTGMLSLPAYAGGGSPRAATAQRAANLTDSQIETTIRTRLAKSKIGKDGFHFHVQHGVVTWEGTTNVMQHKGSATRMARAAGAVEVVNKIQINGDAKAKAMSSLKKASVEQ